MADLVEKFFTADLTDSEEEALDSLLASSEEASGRFAELAAKAYQSFGLPDPGGDTPKSSGWRKPLSLIVLALFLLAGLKVWRSRESRSDLSQASAPSVSLPSHKVRLEKSGTQKTVEKVLPNKLSNEEPSAATSGKTAETMAASPLPLLAETPALTPAPKAHARLRINLAIGQSGPVTVRILDATGLEVKDLYRGNLAAGTYAFVWDGKLDNGRTASPGQYHIQTLDGTQNEVKDFWITAKKKTAP